MKTNHRSALLLAAFAAASAACTALLGFGEGLDFGPAADDGSVVDGGADRDGDTPGSDGGDATTPCDQDKLQTDDKHCGRCNHDCLGGACKAGVCQSVVVAANLAFGSEVAHPRLNTATLAVDGANVYVASRAGTVVRIKKDGTKTDTLVSGHDETLGVVIDGQNIFWTNHDNPGDGGDDKWGGLWACTLPACSDTRLIVTGGGASNVRLSGEFLYFAEFHNSAITRVKPDGSMYNTTGSPNRPFSLAVDAQHVYFEADLGVQRVPLDGGDVQAINPIPAGATLGLITLDADRVYWAYAEVTAKVGRVTSALKATGGELIEYGMANKACLDVAVDDKNVYWTNRGTYDTSFNDDGELVFCAKAGCGGSPVILERLRSPAALLVDGAAIYFVTFGSTGTSADGELRRIARP